MGAGPDGLRFFTNGVRSVIYRMAGLHRHAFITGTPVKIQAARFSIYSNSMLIILKLVVGGMTGSVSVISEAIHSIGPEVMTVAYAETDDDKGKP